MTPQVLNNTAASAAAKGIDVPTLQAVFEQASDGIALIDETQTIVAMNPALERLVGRPAGGIVGRARCRTVLACEDAAGCLLCDRPCPAQEALTAGVATPSQDLFFRTGRGTTTPLSASFTPLRLSPGGRRIVLMIVRNITEQHRKTQRLRHLALTDALTGLENHRSLMAHLRREITRARRYRHALSLLFIDIDEFKRYNDERGHRRGDAALAALGRLLKTQMRETDIAARYGGEEFVLLLPETDKPQARILAEQLRRVIACQLEEPPPGPNGARAGLTVSIGVATFPSDAENGTALLEQADRALYAAKAAGRNRVACSAASPVAADRAPAAAAGSPPQQTHRTLIRGGSP
jgi:diguanylate cyclase (GGDEF)-like protein/PAS domain S-box-containing protein